MAGFSFSRFAYFDTNILSQIAKDQYSWSKLFNYLVSHNLTMGISGAQVVELSDVHRLHKNLAALFVSVPSGLLKERDLVIKEEVMAHPSHRKETLLLYPLNMLLLKPGGEDELIEFLSSNGIQDAREDQLRHAAQMRVVQNSVKPNFPPSKNGKYSQEQADEFADAMTIQWLAKTHRNFMVSFKDNLENFCPKVFLSIRLYAYVIFYKYYLGQREPKKLSDFGDLGHLFYLPYCDLVVMERDLCNILSQIKNYHNILNSTEVKNIGFLEILR